MSHDYSRSAGHGYSHGHGAPASGEPRKIQGQIPGAPAEGDSQLYYALYTVFARDTQVAENSQSEEATAELNSLVEELGADGVTVRGFYDVSAMRNDADVLVWTHAAKPEDLQAAVRKIRRTAAFSGSKIVWSTMGVHRDAEFTRGHTPSFAKDGVGPEAWICVYPFVRSFDWYYSNPEKRAEMLKNHGMKGIDFPQVLPNTIAAFGLNDYEWVIALEAPELVDLVDMMRSFRNTEARLHIREETPFYTGRRIPASDVAGVLA